MQYHWLNKQNNDKLIVFFAGWSFDYIPFEFLNCKDFDVLFVYDYNSIEWKENLTFYSEKYLIAWSMGVFAAYLLKDKLPDFNKKIAVNGTPYPVDDEYGIPQKPFILTLRHAKTGLEGKFYQNIFNDTAEYERFIKTSVERDIENRVDELKSLFEVIKSNCFEYEKFYECAIISNFDKIIPTKNQINFWQNNAPYKLLESGHFPFYNFTSWNEIINYAD